MADPVAMTIAFSATTRRLPPDFSVTSTVFLATSLPRPSMMVAPFALSSERTPPVSFWTMPSFHSCIFGASTLTPPTSMP